MTLLVANLGNSHLRFTCFDESGRITASVRLRSEGTATADELAAILQSAFAMQGMPTALVDVNGVCISSVVPSQNRAVREFFARYLPYAGEPLWITAAAPTDMPVHYAPPESLGADRFVNAYAARALYGFPTIVVDFGTATTFEAIDAGGAYRGGAILPGIGMGRDALAQRAAQLRRIDLDEVGDTVSAIGANTNDALLSGVLLGAVAQTEGLIAHFTAELGATAPPVIATGGFAATVARHTAAITTVDPDLTPKGLRLLYHHLRRGEGESRGRGYLDSGSPSP